MSATKQLVETVSLILNTGTTHIIKSKRGKGGGTFAHKQIALAYAKYLSPKLHVLVNQTFFERIEQEKNPELAVNQAIKSWKNKGMDDKWIQANLSTNRNTDIGKVQRCIKSNKNNGACMGKSAWAQLCADAKREEVANG